MIALYENTTKTITQDDCSLWEYNKNDKTLLTRIKRLHKMTAFYENTTKTIAQDDCSLWEYIQQIALTTLMISNEKNDCTKWLLSMKIQKKKSSKEYQKNWKNLRFSSYLNLHLHYDYKKQKEHKSSHDTITKDRKSIRAHTIRVRESTEVSIVQKRMLEIRRSCSMRLAWLEIA